MKVLFMTNIPSPYRVDFFNELGKICDLTVSFEGKTSTERDNRWVGEKVKRYKPIILKGIRTNSDQFFCFGILRIIRQKWDAIIIGNYSTPTSMLAISYMNLHKIPFIIQADGGIIAENENKLKYLLKRYFISSAKLWMSSGKTTTEYFVHYGAERNNCLLYPFTSLLEKDIVQANELRKRDKDGLREKLGIEEQQVVLSVGRFSYNNGYRKGFDLLLDAAEKLPDNVGVYIVGEDPTEEFVRLKEEKALKHVHYIGFKNKQELMEYYAAADLFVLMSRYDIWGLVINEAMAFGLPIITTNKCVAGVELVTDYENGFIIHIDQPDSLGQKIRYILDNDSITALLGKNSQRKIQSYTIENMAKENMKIIEEYLKNSKNEIDD